MQTMTADRLTSGDGPDPEPPEESTESRRIELVVLALQARLGPAVDVDLIRAEVNAGFEAYADARIHDYVPILVEARVRSRLGGPIT